MKQAIILTVFSICMNCYSQSHVFVFLNSRTDKKELPKEELDKLMDGHLKNIERLAAEGKIVVAGPFEGGGGIFILNTTSIDQANEWLSTDPGIKANRWRVEVLHFEPRIGSVCTAKEPYEMVTYSFIRFLPNIHKDNISEFNTLDEKHYEFVEGLKASEKIIAEGRFQNREGSILIIDGDVDPELLDNDLGIQSGVLLVDRKKLWVAKGSFCEK